jgi:hypothetical protein
VSFHDRIKASLTGIMLALAIPGAALAAELSATPLACGDGLFGWAGHRGDDNHPSNNVSGVDCAAGTGADWTCAAVADEKVSITGFTLTRGAGGGWTCRPGAVLAFPDAYSCFAGNSEAERDFEGVSLDKNGLVATGSWGMSRKKAKLRPSNWTLYRTAILPARGGRCEARERPDLMAFLATLSSARIDRAVDRTLQCGGINIEGFERVDGTYYFGLRSPSDRAEGVAYVIEAPEAAFFGSAATGAAKLHTIKFDDGDGQPVVGIGIRAIDAVGSALYFATGDAGVNASDDALEVSRGEEHGCPSEMAADPPYPNRDDTKLAPMLWSWQPGAAEATLLGTLSGDYAEAKVEGLTIIPTAQGRADAVLAIDSPSEETGQLAVISDLPIP